MAFTVIIGEYTLKTLYSMFVNFWSKPKPYNSVIAIFDWKIWILFTDYVNFRIFMGIIREWDIRMNFFSERIKKICQNTPNSWFNVVWPDGRDQRYSSSIKHCNVESSDCYLYLSFISLIYT